MVPDSIETLLGGLSAEIFLRDYWQRKPLLIRQAFPGFESPLSPDELAGLALEDEIESRIVLEHGSHPWELRRGPFLESDFQNLPERDWTLLVQSVDQFIPEVGELLKAFRFLPSWRLDDVMISYAAPGGGVGPHYDNYDVFLLQGHGRRRWKLGQQCTSDADMLDNPDLKILAEFQTQEEWVLEPGDMLYVPPGLAHHGIAEDECMTYSIGFRAPSHQEVLVHFTDFLAQFASDDKRYGDAGMRPVNEPAELDDASIGRVQAILREAAEDRDALAVWFGRFMTEPRYPERVQAQEIDAEELEALLHQGYGLVRNPSSRLAYRIEAGSLILFASGEHCLLPASLAPRVRLLCNEDYLDAETLLSWRAEPEAWTLVEQLLSKGDLLIEEDDE
jgi:50S ribosomal protein L16 3-hydroxylase